MAASQTLTLHVFGNIINEHMYADPNAYVAPANVATPGQNVIVVEEEGSAEDPVLIEDGDEGSVEDLFVIE